MQVGQAAIAMPTRVEQMSSTLSSLEGGEIKLRVRALEVERAARRASIMQVCYCFFPPIFCIYFDCMFSPCVILLAIASSFLLQEMPCCQAFPHHWNGVILARQLSLLLGHVLP